MFRNVVVQNQRHLLLELIDLFSLGDSRSVWGEEGHSSQESVLRLLELQSFQRFVEVNDQLQKLVLEPYCERR